MERFLAMHILILIVLSESLNDPASKVLPYIPIILLVIIGIYIFNLVIGLIPIFTTIIKTPASILSRYDVD